MRALFLLWMLPALALAGELPFSLGEVAYRSLPWEEAFDGVIEAVQRSTVVAQTSGRVVEVRFDVNDYVEKGEVLLRLDDTAQRAQLERARAALKEAEAGLKQARAHFERIQKLFEKGQVSKAAFDQAEAELKGARARLEAARAQVRQAEEELSYTVVRAPYSGIVVRRHVEVGEAVSPGQPLMTGFSLERLRASAHVPQSLMSQVRGVERARIEIPPLGRVMESRRLTVFPFADAATHTFTVRAELPESGGLYPGMFVKVVFALGERKRLLVPARAVVYRGEVTGVYVVEGEAVRFRQIRIGRPFGEEVEVLAGLSAGERVALEPIKAGAYLKAHE